MMDGMKGNMLYMVRSRRFDVLWCFHFIQTTRLQETRPWVVSFSSLSAFRAEPRLNAGAQHADDDGD